MTPFRNAISMLGHLVQSPSAMLSLFPGKTDTWFPGAGGGQRGDEVRMVPIFQDSSSIESSCEWILTTK